MLLDDIVQLAIDNRNPITSLLRKCLVLAHELKNDTLRSWVTKELNGYAECDEIPDYRKSPAPAKGHFSGPWGSAWHHYPIPSLLLEEEHRHWATDALLRQAIGAYEDLVKSNTSEGRFTIPWPADFVLYYQERIPNSKGMVLNAAYQEIPKSAIVQMLDTVRNRVLSMALELKEQIGETDNDLKRIDPSAARKVAQTIVNNIYGGQLIVATEQSTVTVQQQNISKGDWNHLEQALTQSGLDKAEIAELEEKVATEKTQMGNNVTEWIKKMGPKILISGVKVGTAVGQSLLTEYLTQYYGLK